MPHLVKASCQIFPDRPESLFRVVVYYLTMQFYCKNDVFHQKIFNAS